MIQRAEAMEVEVRQQMRGGNGPVEIRHILKQNQFRAKCRMFSKLVIKPGCSVGMHRHDDEEEVYYILEGEGVVDDNGVKQQIKTGDVMLTGNGEAHSIENTGNTDLVMMAVVLLY